MQSLLRFAALVLRFSGGHWIMLLLGWNLWRVLQRRSERRPGNLTRRGFLTGALVVVGSLGARAEHIEREALAITSLKLPLRDLPAELEGLRIVLIADLHKGPFCGSAYLSRVFDEVNALDPDLVLIPGDFVHRGFQEFDHVAELLPRLTPRLACLGTLGNHDHYDGTGLGRHILPRHGGIELIDNERRFLTVDRRLVKEPPARGLCLAGVADLWTDKPDLKAALEGVPENLPVLLLSHNPDLAEEPQALLSHCRVDLMLSGHTHGGQVRIPGLGTPITASRYGSKYAAGLVQGPRWPVYVSRGIGTSGLPIRFGVAPEITLFTLARDRSGDRPGTTAPGRPAAAPAGRSPAGR